MALLTCRVEGSGPPLVLVHGFLGGANVWNAQFADFSPSYRVIAPNLAGFGDSAQLPCPASISRHAELVLATLSALGCETFHLLGHSMGGMIVQEMAAIAPERIKRLVLYGTGPVGVLPNRFEPIATTRERFQREGFEATVRRIAATWFLHGDTDEGYEACVIEGLKSSLASAYASLESWEQWDGSANLAKLRMPSLIIWGDRDRSYPWQQPEALWRNIPGSSLAVAPGCAHNVHMEAPQLFNQFLRRFFSD